PRRQGPPAVRRQRHHVDGPLVPFEALALLAGRDVPQPHGAVVGARQDLLLAAEGHSPDDRRVPAEDAQLLAPPHVPQPHHAAPVPSRRPDSDRWPPAEKVSRDTCSVCPASTRIKLPVPASHTRMRRSPLRTRLPSGAIATA